ncbi:MAG: SusC/RagA family TonB-linked outer membrane protein [Bacteroidia bacterium]
MKSKTITKTKWIDVLLILIIALSPNFLFAQDGQISGKIIDATTKLPVEGVSISVKDTPIGTISNANGEFTLAVAKGVELIFSSVGYETQKVLANETNLTILMVATSIQLKDLVVTALGVKKDKRYISYASQEVNGSDLTKAREPNAMNGLTGKVAGLTVGASAELLGNPQVLLRGGAIYLYVVDGVPINSDTWNLSPDDIESYTILKGPVASSLYGYRGQNGAIIITTKKGSKDKRGFAVEFNSSTMFQKGFIALPLTQDLYGPGDHGKYSFVDGKGAGTNDGDYDVWGPKFEGQLIAQYDSPVDPITGVRTPTPWTARGKDNLKRFVRTGILTNNNIAVSSSGDKYDLRFSISNSHQRGIIPNTDLNTINFNLASSLKFNKKLKMDANLNFNKQFTDNIPDVNYGPNSVVYNMSIWGGADWDVEDMKDYWQPGKEGVQSKYVEYQRYHNPYFMSHEWLRGHHKNDIYGYTALTYKFNKYFDLMGRTSISTYDLTRTEKMPFSAHPYGREEGRGDYREDKRSLFENNTEAILRVISPKIANFVDINGLVGTNLRLFSYASSFVTTDYLNVPNVYNFANSKNPVKAYSFNSEMIVRSAFYSFDFALGKFANLNTTGRVDKLSALSNANNTFFYPSLSANTILTDYIQLPKAINFLKLRASYAQSRGGGAFVSNTIGATPNNTYPIGYGTEYTSTYGGPSYSFNNVYSTSSGYNNTTVSRFSSSLIDENIKPDNRTNSEFGLEIKLLKNRLSLDVAYFNYIDGPQIFTQQISQTSGYTNNIINATKTQKKGLELTLKGTPVKMKNSFSWDVLVNWSKFTETFKELPEGLTTINTFYKVGSRTDEVYIRKFARTQDGKIINDGGGRPIILPVAQFAGHSNPDWVWSIYNKLNYKSFTLGFQFDGRVGGVMEDYVRKKTFQGGRHIETTEGDFGVSRDQDALGVKSYLGEGVQVSSGVIKFDAVTGEITNYGELQYTDNATKTFVQDYISRVHSIPEPNMMSKTYTKLREVVLTYRIPTSLTQKGFIQGASVSFVARNVLYFMKDNRFKDVDIDQYGNQTITNLQTPTMRSYGINLNLTF